MQPSAMDMPFLAPLNTSKFDLMDPRLLISTPPATPPKSQASSETASITVRDEREVELQEDSGKMIPRGEYIEDVDEEGSQPPELTEVSAAAMIRLAHRVLELYDVIGMWSDFRGIDTKGTESDYLTRCYISEVFSSWRALQRQYHDVTWLRENGNGTRKATRLEKELAKLMDRVGEWRSANMPRQSRRPYNRRSWNAEWRTAGAIGSGSGVCGGVDLPGVNGAGSCSGYSSRSNSGGSSISNGYSSHFGGIGLRCSTICEVSPLTAPESPLPSPPLLPPIISTKDEDWWNPGNGNNGGIVSTRKNNVRPPVPLPFMPNQKQNPHHQLSHHQQPQSSWAPNIPPTITNKRAQSSTPSSSLSGTQLPPLQTMETHSSEANRQQQKAKQQSTKSHALGLAEVIVSTLGELQLSRAYVDKDIELIRKQLLLSQFHWLERQAEKRRAGTAGSSSGSSNGDCQAAS